MEPSVVLPDTGLAAVRRRRVSLRAAMTSLEESLAVPASGRIGVWAVGVDEAAVEVGSHLNEHIETSEGPQGFHVEILAAAPRLSHAVATLVSDHEAASDILGQLLTRVEEAKTQEDVDAIRELGTELLSRLTRHRQRGADLIYEAYEYDLGGED
jgi:hypothetical protein